jgi:hypothetical protein
MYIKMWDSSIRWNDKVWVWNDKGRRIATHFLSSRACPGISYISDDGIPAYAGMTKEGWNDKGRLE